MSIEITRRGALGAGLAAAAIVARPARAAKPFNVLSHRVHQVCLTQGAAGDQTGNWRRANDAEITWTTFDTEPLQDRMFREASLERSDVHVGYLVSGRATANSARLLHGLDAYQSSAPVEAFDDISPSLRRACTLDGKLAAIPVRHATQGLFYNEAMLESRGISAPPRSLEELVDQARRLTFRAEDGRPVVGLVLASDRSVFPVAFARAFGGDFISPELRLLPNPDAMVSGIATMRAMYEAGSMPRSYATITNDDQATWLLQGRAAFTVLPFARHAQLNDPSQSRYPGRLKAIEFPLSETVRGRERMASVTEFWALCILGNARDKDLAWSFIREMSSKAVTLGAARNGNGPVRVSTYDEPSFSTTNPLATVEGEALRNARVSLPAFPESSRAQAIFVEEVTLAVLGRKTPGESVASITQRVRPLLPG